MRAACVLVLALAATADARPFSNIGGGAQLHYELSTLHDVDHAPGKPGSPQDLVLAGVRLHGFVGGTRFGFHVGIDLAAGQTARPHSFLAYDVAVFPVGVALRFAETSFVALGAGVGRMGALGTLDDGTMLPFELTFELGRGLRVLGRVRATFVGDAPRRQDGAPSTTLADELEASLGVRLGEAYRDWGFPSGDGYFIAANYREWLGARYLGVTLGFSIDAGTPRTRRR